MPRYALTIAYDGTDFHGWQKQHPPDSEPLRTVQGLLEAAVEELIREPVHVLGASRTDSGVHAEGQVACFNSPRTFDPTILPAALTSRLPQDVQVRSAWEVEESFNPIGDALSKGYRYRLAHSRPTADIRPLFDRHVTAWCPGVLDVEAMQRAAKDLVGEHDFSSMTRVRHNRETTVREIFDCTVTEEGDDRLSIDVCGSGFLWNMVRIIAGTLVEVGEGRIDPTSIPDIIASGDRQRSGRTMPPEGLCLMWIRFGAPGSGQARQQLEMVKRRDPETD
ncbi:MAG: tRNA pseudouridine(38-40) synthase TruA [Planctomycetota bacterium]|nr:tRNA pseudouridine(38-40) synthase TruA [Planctomycetota bacterium]